MLDGAESEVIARVGKPKLLLWVCVMAQRGQNATAWPLEFCLGGSCVLTFALTPDTAVSPCMPLVPCVPGGEAQRE